MKKEHFKYRKFDLHIHTNKRNDTYDNRETRIVDKSNVNDFYNKMLKNNIELISITNHNYFDYNNYHLIKETLNSQEKKIKVLPGIEISTSYEQQEFHMNMIFPDEKEKALEEEINKLFEKNHKQSISLDSILSWLTKCKRKVIIIPDVSKSSSKIPIKEMDNDFWFYFDFFEGNVSFSKQKWYQQFDKLKKRLNSHSPKVANAVFGTDNIDFYEYPNNRERVKGWTGTFFSCEPTFEALKICTFFPRLITKLPDDMVKDYTETKSKNPLFAPALEPIEIYSYKDTILDRGLNVIYGKRGTGKTYFMNSLAKYLKSNTTAQVKIIRQNEITEIVEKMKTSDAIFLDRNNDDKTREKWDVHFKKQVITKLNGKFSNQFSFINKKNYKDQIVNISNYFKKVVSNEISNQNFTVEQEIISKSNQYFKSLSFSFSNIVKDLSMIKDLKFTDDKAVIKSVFIKHFNWELAKQEIIHFVNNKLMSLKFSHKENNQERKTNSELLNKISNEFKIIKKIAIDNHNIISSLSKAIEEFADYEKLEKLTFKNVDVFSADIKIWNKYTNDTFSAITSYFNFKKLDLQSFKKNIFLIPEMNDKKATKKLRDCLETTWVFKMKNQEINHLSPGQRANKYLENLFVDSSYKILLIDQPEDQLDAESTKESIIKPIIERHRTLIAKGVQIILISHDPKIIINACPTNLIKTEVNNNSKKTDEKNYYSISNIALSEFVNNPKNIDIIDGKKEYVHTRSYLYGEV